MPQPYQILFPIGLFYALWGALVWVFFAMGWMNYPGQDHSFLMITGFLFSFSSGFLLTAVPRFTGSESATRLECGLAGVLALLPFVASGLGADLRIQAGGAILILSFFCGFLGKRFRKRTFSPPKHFVFLPLGLILGLAGAALLLFGVQEAPWRIFLFQGVMLSFVLGVGGKLVSALLGWSSSPLVQIVQEKVLKRGPLEQALRTPAYWQAFILAVSFLLELTPYPSLARTLRAASATWVAGSAWKLYRRPKIPGRLTDWIWVSCWALLIGLWVYALVPVAGIHGLHLMFIGGFGLLTLMVATRVTLAHGGYDVELEIRSRPIVAAGVLVTLAALVRSFAPWSGSYLLHLACAAVLWSGAVIVWSFNFLPKIIRHSR